MDLGPGSRLSRFLLEETLGKGASGVVYLARDTLLDQAVALKVLHPWLVDDPEVRERFKREIVLTRRINSAGVSRLHDLHEEDGHTFITMEYVAGETLAALIHREGRQPPARVLEILRGIVPALQAAHDVGVVHRDLKPGNIMIKPDGSVCVLDFGMATGNDVTRITQAGRTVGSLRFIAPEVWQGEQATSQSDLYALGVVLYACMAGRLPFEASTPAEAFKAQKQGPPSLLEHNPDVSPAVDAVVRRAMARRPSDRYANADALLSAFARAVNGEEPTSSTGTVLVREASAAASSQEGPAVAVEPAVPRAALITAVVVVTVVAVAVVAALMAKPAPPPPTPPQEAKPASAPRAGDTEDAGSAEAAGDAADAGVAGAGGTGSPDAGVTNSGSARVHDKVKSGSAGSVRLAAAMKRRGVLPGDVPTVDALAARAHRLEAQGNNADALWSKARSVALHTRIDRGFINAKEKRLTYASESAPASHQAKILSLQRDVARLVVQRRYTAANDRLNRAFALTR